MGVFYGKTEKIEAYEKLVNDDREASQKVLNVHNIHNLTAE